MAGKTATFENETLRLWFNAVAIANLADNAAASPAGVWWISLHTADPTDAGNQSSSEATYAGYARVAVTRDASGFTVVGSTVTLAALLSFPLCTSGNNLITHLGVGLQQTGGGALKFSGPVTPNIAVADGVTPQLSTGTSIVES
jgi:hypothetical protein